MPQIQFTIAPHDAGQRLDAVLVRLLAEAAERGELSLPAPSRSELRRWFERDLVQVSDPNRPEPKPAKPAQDAAAGAVVTVELPAPPPVRLAPDPSIEWECLFEDEQLAVINKPAGLVVHPQRITDTGTLANGLVARYGDALPLADEAGLMPGIVHRLDADTSGAIVIARTEQALVNLKAQFRARTVQKHYLAVAHGAPEWEQIDANFLLARDPYRGESMRVDNSGRPAHTRFRVLQKFNGFTLIEADLKTGRTHQIRVHLAHLGHPVVCDRLYGGKAGATQLTLLDIAPPGFEPAAGDRIIIDRQALHAARLSFDHPANAKRLNFEAQLPDDLEGLLMALRIHRQS